MDPKIDFGNGIIVKEAIMENAAYISIEAITKVIPKEYLCVAVLKEILGIAKRQNRNYAHIIIFRNVLKSKRDETK